MKQSFYTLLLAGALGTFAQPAPVLGRDHSPLDNQAKAWRSGRGAGEHAVPRARLLPTVNDAVQMERIQRVASNGRLGAISPDGQLLAFVSWRGDLAKNVNVFSLRLLDLSGRSAARTIATQDYAGDPHEGDASPFEQVAFAGNNIVTFLGRPPSGPRQVFAVEISTGRLIQLTQATSDVREFVADARGVRFYSAVSDTDRSTVRRQLLEGSGGFLWDSRMFDYLAGTKSLSVVSNGQRLGRRYFALGPDGPRLVYDSLESQPPSDVLGEDEIERGFSIQLYDDETLNRFAMLVGDPTGRRALVYPYAPVRLVAPTGSRSWEARMEVPYGLVDLQNGGIRLLPEVRGGASDPVPQWSPDGLSAAIFTRRSGTGWSRAASGWAELSLEDDALHPLPVPSGWDVIGWARGRDRLILARDNQIGLIDRSGRGWSAFRKVGDFPQFNRRAGFVTNGRTLVAMREGPTMAPDLVALDLETRSIRSLTDLNPEIRRLQFGEVQDLVWSNAYNPAASGFLIMPPGYVAGRRYPLVILLDDGFLKRMPQGFLLDGFMQRGGHAAQMIAAAGMVVLYSRDPRGLAGPSECEIMREHVESAVAALDRRSLVDPARVGLSGFSRAGYHTNCILMRARRPLAAASQIDGGGREFLPSVRPFTDDELGAIRTPLLLEAHGRLGLAVLAPMADRLDAMGRPTEMLYFPTAAHDLARPNHRIRSLDIHLDWWRFWLMGQEDPAPDKTEQYRRWRELRATWQARALPVE